MDVTDLSEKEQKQMVEMFTEYSKYVESLLENNTYSFENWVSHVKNEDVDPKWRTFKKDSIAVV